VKRMEACVMVLRPVKATQYLMCYSYRRRGGATYLEALCKKLQMDYF